MSPWLHNTIPCLFCIQPKGLPKLIAFPSFAALTSKSYWRRHLAFANFWREAWPKWSQHMLSISWGHPPPSVPCDTGHYHLAAAWLPLWTVVPNPVDLALWATYQSQQLLSYESDQAICVPPPLGERLPWEQKDLKSKSMPGPWFFNGNCMCYTGFPHFSLSGLQVLLKLAKGWLVVHIVMHKVTCPCLWTKCRDRCCWLWSWINLGAGVHFGAGTSFEKAQ